MSATSVDTSTTNTSTLHLQIRVVASYTITFRSCTRRGDIRSSMGRVGGRGRAVAQTRSLALCSGGGGCV
ncbi:hypothetical protein E2C01_016599 [Portunus trituberculatus]|uniref:Uncharacterized protein n=1 Tax=Portunus trituberculatus TaxID=210409 RepID=A0A5B7DQN2_PORTR|nr:hypothetical protein [Portunus trituberculatus]